jgi:hypothetical protein
MTARPVHEKKERADHGNELALVGALAPVLLVANGFAIVEEISGSKSEVSTESVDVHGASQVNCAEETNANSQVEAVEKNLESS